MRDEAGRIAELEAMREHLHDELGRYRKAAELALKQLDWCVRYFADENKGAIARRLSANSAHIKQQYLKRRGD